MQTEEKNNDRGLVELLTLNTYQGMTDSEIETLIEYRANIKFQEEMHSERMKMTLENESKRLNAVHESCMRTEAMLESMLNRELALKKCEDVQ